MEYTYLSLKRSVHGEIQCDQKAKLKVVQIFPKAAKMYLDQFYFHSDAFQNSPSGHHVLYLGNLSMRVFEIRPTGHTSGIEKCLFVGWGNSFQCPSNSFRVGWEPWSSG